MELKEEEEKVVKEKEGQETGEEEGPEEEPKEEKDKEKEKQGMEETEEKKEENDIEKKDDKEEQDEQEEEKQEEEEEEGPEEEHKKEEEEKEEEKKQEEQKQEEKKQEEEKEKKEQMVKDGEGEDVYARRRRRLESVCAAYGDRLLAPLRKYNGRLRYETAHGFMYCENYKIGSTAWAAQILAMNGVNITAGEVKRYTALRSFSFEIFSNSSIPVLRSGIPSFSKVPRYITNVTERGWKAQKNAT